MRSQNIVTKQWMEVLSVVPSKKEISGRLRDGGRVAISMSEIPPAFRWPKEGEIWSIERDRLDFTKWGLGSRIHVNPDAFRPEDMKPGELRMDSNNVTDSEGRVFVTVDITDIEDGWTIRWSATDQRFVVGP
jgi:hypothetical protein